MMRRDGLTIGARGVVAAILLTMAAVAVGWLCVRTSIVEALPPDSAAVARVAPHDPGTVLARETVALVKQRGVLGQADLARVRQAAARAPLDARAFLILGHQQLLDREPVRALRTFEAGQRLDARQRLLHILLLDRYLRTGRYDAAAAQMAVMARLISETGTPVAQAMAAMAIAPETRTAVRRTLDGTPRLEPAVLAALARSGVSPEAIFAFASAAARASAGVKEGWGEVLVARLVERGRFAEARAVWARVYRIPPVAAAAPIVNPRFAPSAPPPPFGWTLIAGSLGAADLRNGALAVDYYGRDSGDLATQLLVLAPGRYRFAFTVDAGKTDAAARLFWSIACATGTKASLADVAVVAGASPRRLAADLVVPAACPAQTLTLRGEAGDLPAPTGATLRDLDLRPVGARP